MQHPDPEMKKLVTEDVSLTVPISALSDKESATTFERPFTYLNLGQNSYMVRYHRASLHVKFLPLNTSATTA